MDRAMRNNNSSSDGAVRNYPNDFTSLSSDQLMVSGSTVAIAISGIVCAVFVTCICCLCGYSKVKKVRTRNLESNLAPVTVFTTSQLMTQISVQDYPPPYSPPPEFPGDMPLQYPTSPTNYSLSPAHFSSPPQPWAPSRHLTLQIPFTRSSQVYPETPPPTYMQLAACLNWEVFPDSSSNDEDKAYGKVVRADTSDGPLTSSSTFAIGFGLILVLLLIHFTHSLVMKIRSDTTFYKSASGESDPSESEPPMVLSSPSAPQEEDSPKAEWILPSTKSQEDFKDPSEVSKAPSEVSKDPSEVPPESPPTYRDSVAESSKPQNQSFELTTSL